MKKFDSYCSMIHGGLSLNFHSNELAIGLGHCCLMGSVDTTKDADLIWSNPKLIPLRQLNAEGKWDKKCQEICQRLEKTRSESFRTGMNNGLGIDGQTDLSGPLRIDLMFDMSCNLACRTCGPQSSTFWQKHLRENGYWNKSTSSPRQKNEVINALSNLDLSNLRQLVFCGGETLMGNAYWEVAEWLSNNVPNAETQLTLCFQTNGTQTINPKYYETIKKFFLVKLHCSIDGVAERFEYLRWPAQWKQTTDNLLHLREVLPSNVMFVVEETVSIFNLMYLNELDEWYQTHFSHNREGDVVNLTRHLAHGIFSVKNCTQEYVEHLKNTPYANLVTFDSLNDFNQIKKMLNEIEKFDSIRGQSFKKSFPEVAKMYKNYNE